MNFRTVLKALALPLVLLAILLLFAGLYDWLGFPNSDELIRLSRSYLQAYGYWIVFIAAFIETIPPINFYLPGSAVVVLSVAYTRGGDLNVMAVLALVVLAFVLAFWLDYLIGKFGWYRVLEWCGMRQSLAKARDRVSRHGTNWLWFACIHPNLGALAATSCGILGVPVTRFLWKISAATIVWVAVWGAAAYFGGDWVLCLTNLKWLIAVVCIWILVRAFYLLRKSYENDDQ